MWNDLNRLRRAGSRSSQISRWLAGACLPLLFVACQPRFEALFDKDGDSFLTGEDCDDSDPAIGSRYPDLDGDGHGAGDPLAGCADLSAPGFAALGTDCDDRRADVHPAAPEICDKADNDCNASVDEGLPTPPWYPDVDLDGFGDPEAPVRDCMAPEGHLEAAGDCDDADPGIHPGVEEVCDDVDANCDGSVDQELYEIYYADVDQDTFGDPDNTTGACDQPEGYVTNEEDCDDGDASRQPGAEEVCDGLDTDCDNIIDEGVLRAFYADVDQDGFGDAAAPQVACSQPEGTSTVKTDCDDADPDSWPGAEEQCDDRDNDCDREVDDGLTFVTYHLDADEDGYGDPETSVSACRPVEGYLEDDRDCDDGDPQISPDAVESCDGIDEDCDSAIDDDVVTRTWYADRDGDGFGDPGRGVEDCAQPVGYVEEAGDCDDTSEVVFPGAEETVGDDRDSDCDGRSDWLVRAAGRRVGFRGDGGPATAAELFYPAGAVLEASGALYIADSTNHRIRRVGPDGVIETVAGNGAPGFAGDGGPATAAQIQRPADILVMPEGALVFTDRGNHRVRRIGMDGTITTLAGTGLPGFAGEGGPAIEAQLNSPGGLTIDEDGRLYVADSGNHRVRRLELDGTLVTVAGGAGGFGGDNGPATEARLSSPDGLAIDLDGGLLIADVHNHRIRKVRLDGTIVTVAGSGLDGDEGDGGPALEASFFKPAGIAVDLEGRLFIADTGNHRVRAVDLDGVIDTVAGGERAGFAGDGGPATEAALLEPRRVLADGLALWVVDEANHRVRAVDAEGVITTRAGSGSPGFGGDGGPATLAELSTPLAIAADLEGGIYVADTGNHRVRRVSSGGIGTVVGGGSTDPGVGEAAPLEATLDSPAGVAVAADGSLYLSDTGHHRVLRLTPEGGLELVAGDGTPGYAGDGGSADQALLGSPRGLAVDDTGRLFIADADCHCVRMIDADGIISTVAGTGSAGAAGEGGAATAAQLNAPSDVAVDADGTLYIADTNNHRVCAVGADGMLDTLAGTGMAGYSAESGPATGLPLSYPRGVAVDEAGFLFIADTSSLQIRMVTPEGLIQTVSGTGNYGTRGDDAPAAGAEYYYPSDVVVGGEGDLYILDALNQHVRRLMR